MKLLQDCLIEITGWTPSRCSLPRRARDSPASCSSAPATRAGATAQEDSDPDSAPAPTRVRPRSAASGGQPQVERAGLVDISELERMVTRTPPRYAHQPSTIGVFESEIIASPNFSTPRCRCSNGRRNMKALVGKTRPRLRVDVMHLNCQKPSPRRTEAVAPAPARRLQKKSSAFPSHTCRRPPAPTLARPRLNRPHSVGRVRAFYETSECFRPCARLHLPNGPDGLRQHDRGRRAQRQLHPRQAGGYLRSSLTSRRCTSRLLRPPAIRHWRQDATSPSALIDY